MRPLSKCDKLLSGYDTYQKILSRKKHLAKPVCKKCGGIRKGNWADDIPEGKKECTCRYLVPQ